MKILETFGLRLIRKLPGGAGIDLGLMIRDREVSSIRSQDMVVNSFREIRGTSGSRTSSGMVRVVSVIRASRVNVSGLSSNILVFVHQCLRLEHHRQGES